MTHSLGKRQTHVPILKLRGLGVVGFANTAIRTEVEAGALLSLAISVLRFISDLKYGDYSPIVALYG